MSCIHPLLYFVIIINPYEYLREKGWRTTITTHSLLTSTVSGGGSYFDKNKIVIIKEGRKRGTSIERNTTYRSEDFGILHKDNTISSCRKIELQQKRRE